MSSNNILFFAIVYNSVFDYKQGDRNVSIYRIDQQNIPDTQIITLQNIT